MPLTYDIVPQEPHLRIAATGGVSISEIVETVYKAGSDPRHRPDCSVVLDFSKASYSPQVEDGETLVKSLHRRKGIFLGRIAVVVANSNLFLGKLYCMIVSLNGVTNVRCFTDIGEAHDWCRQSGRP